MRMFLLHLFFQTTKKIITDAASKTTATLAVTIDIMTGPATFASSVILLPPDPGVEALVIAILCIVVLAGELGVLVMVGELDVLLQRKSRSTIDTVTPSNASDSVLSLSSKMDMVCRIFAAASASE